MISHATQPIVHPLGNDIYRVYFSCRDEKHRSHVGYVEFDINAPAEILHIANEPALIPGPIGHFDEHGAYGGCLVQHEHQLWMYYLGWNQGAKSPLWYSSIGLAVSDDGGRIFRKVSPAPIMQRSQFDPCTVLLPSVMKEGSTWRMWYGSGFKWEEDHAGLHSYYDIKHATSQDGIEWQREGAVCIGLKAGEKNAAHPCVIMDNGTYKMWYSYNVDQGYRIGYAESPDGSVWARMDGDTGIEISASGWDSETLSHPHVFIHDGKKYMLYNGNGYGRDGFGLAIAEG